MHKTTALSLAIAVTVALAAPAALAQVAKVNGITIPQSRSDALVREAAAQGRPDNPELRNLVKQRLTRSRHHSPPCLMFGPATRTSNQD